MPFKYIVYVWAPYPNLDLLDTDPVWEEVVILGFNRELNLFETSEQSLVRNQS